MASVNQEGVVTGTGNGMTTIRAISNDNRRVEANCRVTVGMHPSEVVREVRIKNSPAGFLIKGNKYNLREEVLPETAADKRVAWTSNNVRVAAVGLNTGIVEALNAGTATITARSSANLNEVATCRIFVAENDTEEPLTAVEIRF